MNHKKSPLQVIGPCLSTAIALLAGCVSATSTPAAVSNPTSTPPPTLTPIPMPESAPLWPTEGWRASTPEQQGLDSDLLLHMLQAIEDRGLNVHGALVIRAILGGLWHLPLFFYSRFQHAALADFPYSGWIAQQGFLVAIGTLMLMFLLPWSIIHTWLFNNTRGSLLLVAVLHGSEIWVAYWMLSTGMAPSNLNNYWGFGAVMVMIAITIVIAAGSKDLSRTYKRIVHQPSIGQDTPTE